MRVQLRKERGSKVRELGYIPGVFYGKDIETTMIQTDEKSLKKMFNEMGYTRSFDIELNGKRHSVVIRDIQFDILNHNQIIHFDLLKVSEDDVITAFIPIRLVGREVVEKTGGIIQLVSDSLEYEFPANKGIPYLEVDVSQLEVGDTITAKDVVVPEGFVLRDEPTKPVVTLTTASVSDEVEADTETSTEDTAVDNEEED